MLFLVVLKAKSTSALPLFSLAAKKKTITLSFRKDSSVLTVARILRAIAVCKEVYSIRKLFRFTFVEKKFVELAFYRLLLFWRILTNLIVPIDMSLTSKKYANKGDSAAIKRHL